MLSKYISDIENILTNKYFIGIFMIIINIGSRFIIEELTPNQRKYINKKLVRRIFVFCVFFMATKDILATITLTLMFILFISNLFIDDTEKGKDEEELHNDKQKILIDIEQSLNKHLS
jgi:putative Mn2+ efflux pump MntP